MDFNVNPKLEKVLKKLLEPNFKIKNEVYLNQLLTHITDQSATAVDSKSIDKENRSYYVSWLKSAIEKWDIISPPRQDFLTFAFYIAAFICSDEQTFVSLNCENVFEGLATIANRFNSPSLKLANIKLLTAFLEHKSGLQWVISTNSWNDVLTTALNCPTVYISKEACLFITKLLEKSIDMNEAFCSNIMYLILIPLKQDKLGIDEESYYLSLKPSLSLISNILELLLQRSTFNCKIAKKILAKFNLEKHLADLKNTQNKQVFFDVYSILHLIGFFELLFKFGGVQEPLDFQKISQPSIKYCGITEKFSETLSNPQMLCFLGNSLRYWSHIRHKMTLCVNNGSIPMQFENQLMILQLLPVAMISMRLINPNPDNLSGNDDIRDMFFTKIIKNSLPNTFRVVYKWKARFPNQTSFSDASMGLKYFLHSKQHYSRDVANTAFQMLLYTLRDVTDVVKDKPDMVPLTSEAVSFLVLLLTAIVELIKGFSLSWKDSVETVAVLEIAFNCLNFPTWPAKVNNRVPNARIKELLLQWLKDACKPTKSCLPPDVLQFAIDVIAELSGDEMVFVVLNAHHVFENVLKISKDLITKQAVVQLSYIRMMKSFVQHKSGVQWIMSYSSWTDIVTLILNNPIVNVFNGSCEVLMLFLEKVADLNYGVCCNVIQYIVAPLRSDNIAAYRGVDEDQLYEYLQPTLELLLFVLRWLLEKIIVTPKCKLALLFLDTFKVTEILTDIKPTKNKYLIFKVHRLLGYTGPFTFLRMFHGLATVEYSKYDKLCQECLENFYIIAETKLVHEILECNYQFMMFWLKHKADGLEPAMVGSRGKVLLIEHQILLTLLFIISPRVSVFFVGDICKAHVVEQDEIRDQFLTEVFSKCTPQTVAMCYKIHNCWPKETLFRDATLALNYISIGRKHFTLEMANMTLQFIIYSLKDITQNLKEKQQLWEALEHDFFKYMTLLLDTMVNFCKEFNITWREITETISVLDIAFSCLVCYPHWPQNVVVKGLELVDVAISKYMSPNMALLIDKVHDSVMGLLGPMLYAKLHDIHWEVRDSALEVICTITHISNKKFPSYRKVIQDAEFPSMVIRLAKKDEEAFVRASALKCLTEMIQVEDFWWDFQNSFNIFEEILNILVYEPEGIVRSEAATVVATIYEHQNVPKSYLGNMYDVASHAATADLHWEVKAKALMFWNKVIEKHLTHQGMIDGTFPEVTFSKENRKIVTLNDAEVKKRLIKVLEQLSATGCLAVFAAALQDDSDLEVAKVALDLIKDFVAMLKKYKVTEQDLALSTPVSPLDRFSNSPFPSTPSIRSLDSQYGTMSPSSDLFQMDLVQTVRPTPIDDAILESILDSEDIGLLDAVTNPPDQVAERVVNLKTIQVLPSRQFLNFIYGDLDGRLKERSRWLEQIDSFDSLLDDILKDYQVEGVNAMDCY